MQLKNLFCRIGKFARKMAGTFKGFFINYFIRGLRTRHYHRQIGVVLNSEIRGTCPPPVDGNQIGNTIWVFWYQGMEQAPPLVRKCIDVKTLSDIIRLQLISRHGGIWVDATLLVMDRNLLSQIRTMPYFSIRHSHADFFNKSLWSTYCMAGGKGNPFFSLAYDIYIKWFEKQDCILDYFMTDYILLYIYRNYPWAAEMVDSMKPVVRDAYWINRNWYEKFDEAKWSKMAMENSFQKLNWKSKDGPLSDDSIGYFVLYSAKI